MSKITNVLIIDSNTLRLEVDAFKGDEIDLTVLNKVDTTTILRQIELGKDNVYNQKVKELKEILLREKSIAIDNALKDKELIYKEELSKVTEAKNNLEMQLENLKSTTQNTINLALKDNEIIYNNKLNNLEKEKNDLLIQLENLKNNTQIAIKNAELEKEKKLDKELNELKNQVDRLNEQLKNQKELADKNLEYKTLELEKKYLEEIALKDKLLNNLKLEKSSLNSKKIGEELENWCNNEFVAYSQTGFSTCTWEKDNKSIKDDDETKGTKADYIFKVYANENKVDNELLSSVICEMKNEDPYSKKKKKNSDFYKKLDDDRRKKNCEYALLVSELEWDYSNDVPIRIIPEYEKMYLVRPQYFITFLSIVAGIGLKFKELLLNENKRIEQFRDQQEILDEFEKFKQNLLDKPIIKLEKEVESIKKHAGEIIKLSNKIDDSANEIIKKGIDQIKKQVDNFNISKLVKKIGKIN